jgi:sirohydrochlorin cobaltochelatase
MKGILICGHGSRSAEAFEDFKTVVEKYKALHPTIIVAYGFLEFSKPIFADAVQSLYEQGVREIDALQLFLFSGKHISSDVPQKLQKIESNYSDLKIIIHEPIGKYNSLMELLTKSVLPFVNINKRQALITVGVGASVNEANKQVTDLSLQLAKAVEITNLRISFMSTMAKPNFEETITELANTEVEEIIVVPLLLFNGVYYSSILKLSNELELRMSKQISVLPTLAFNDGFITLMK